MIQMALYVCTLFLLCSFAGTDAAISAWASPGTASNEANGNITAPSIAENSRTEGDTIFTAQATAAGTVEYALISSTDSVGIMAATDGVVRVATGKALDYEAFTTYQFVITGIDVVDNPATTATVTVRLGLTDVNDNTPAFSDTTFSASVADKSALGATVMTLTATDGDATEANNVITYSINSGNTNTDFAIDGSTGIVTVAATNGLDKATTSSYALVIHATDSGSTPRTGSTTLSITISAAAESVAALNLVSPLTLAIVGMWHMLV